MDNWQSRGLCRVDPDLFYAPDGESDPARVRREVLAKAICGPCPVKLQCRAESDEAERDVAFSSWWGVWGGENRDERRRRRKRERRVA